MLDQIQPENLLFLDIETVPAYPSYEEMSEELKILWDKKAPLITREAMEPSEAYARAGIYAEFGRIICISVGLVHKKDGEPSARIKSFFGDEEKPILEDFKQLLMKIGLKEDFSLCAHNGREFDFPYIARRMLINGISLPAILDIAGRKPWEVKFIDTMELWKFGDYKHYTSLELLAHSFGIPSPKDDIDGSMVGKVYYEEKDLERIVKYCEKDVLTIIQLLQKLKGEEMIKPDRIVFAGEKDD